MNLIDVILIVIILLSIYNGWVSGFILGMSGLLIWIGSLLLAFLSYPYGAKIFIDYTHSQSLWITPLSFIFTMLLFRIMLSLLLRFLLKKVPAQTHVHPANRALGIFPGAFSGLLSAAIVAFLILALPLFDGLSIQAKNSKVASKLTDPLEYVENAFTPIFDEAVNHTLNKLIINPSSGKLVKLPFSVKHPKVRMELEEEMLALLNEERKKEGLNPLKMDKELTEVARRHSQDMFARGYFSHVTPDGKDPFDRIRKAKVRFITAGENLALAQTLSIAHQGLMKSPGHRANILRPQFGRVGIGILDGGMYGYMITQNFRN